MTSQCSVCGKRSKSLAAAARYDGIRARSAASVSGLQLE